MIKIVVLGETQSQLRPIFKPSLVNVKIENNILVDYKLSGTAIDHKKCRDYKKKVAETAINFYKGKPLSEPLKVNVSVYRGIPKSWSKVKKEKAISGELMVVTTPDVDNLFKGLIDGLTGIVWKDDNCIVEANIKKIYSTVPRAEVEVFRLKDGKWV